MTLYASIANINQPLNFVSKHFQIILILNRQIVQGLGVYFRNFDLELSTYLKHSQLQLKR